MKDRILLAPLLRGAGELEREARFGAGMVDQVPRNADGPWVGYVDGTNPRLTAAREGSGREITVARSRLRGKAN